VAAYGPLATVFSDNCPQFRSTFFQGVCSLLGISNQYSSTYHPQTNGQVERYNRTIVRQLRTCVEDHQDRWDELVSMLTLAYNSRPQQSTGVAPLEFVTPERVRSLSVERLVGSPAPEEMDGSPRAVREGIRARLRNLIHEVRNSLTLAQRRYKRNYDARVRPVNKDVHLKDWVFVDGHTRTKYKLGTRAAGPYKVLSRGEGTFSLDTNGYPETVSSDHVTAAPGPPGSPQTLLQNLGVPQDIVVPEGHQHTGKEFVWEAFVRSGQVWPDREPVRPYITDGKTDAVNASRAAKVGADRETLRALAAKELGEDDCRHKRLTSETFMPGIENFLCPCGLLIGYDFLDKVESPSHVLASLVQRFPLLPKVVFFLHGLPAGAQRGVPRALPCQRVLHGVQSEPGVVMDMSLGIISLHYMRIHFGYEPATHIQNAL